MKSNFDKVNDFNTCFGHFITNEKFTNIFTENPKLVELKYSLINEEVCELRDALFDNDIKEIIDALCDIEYVINGLAGAFGFNIDEEFRKFIISENIGFNNDSNRLYNNIKNNHIKLNISNVPWCQHKINIDSIVENTHISNYQVLCFINKIYYEKTQRTEYRVHDSIYSNIKDYKLSWDSRKLYGNKVYLNKCSDFYKNLSNKEFRDYLNLLWFDISHENELLKYNIEQHKYDECVLSSVRLLFHITMMSIFIGYDHDGAFNIVHTSNMTKICGNQEDAIKTVEWYKKNNHKYKTPAYKKNEFGYVIYNKDTNKVLKSIYYTPANFDKFFSKYSGAAGELDIKTRWFVIG
jgi:predicted HAD superfamily Cof-like phosphohydrolase